MTNLRFDTDDLARKEEELEKLAERLHKASIADGMEISAEKTKLIKNNIAESTKRSK